MSGESSSDIVESCYFTDVAHNMRLSVSDAFLGTENTLFGWYRRPVRNSVINNQVSCRSLNLLDNFGIGSYRQKFPQISVPLQLDIFVSVFFVN